MKTWVATAAAVLAAVLAGAPAAIAQVAFPQTPVGASSANQDIAFVTTTLTRSRLDRRR
jgi:hypothetical protein